MRTKVIINSTFAIQKDHQDSVRMNCTRGITRNKGDRLGVE